MFGNEIMLKSSMTTLSKHDTSLIRLIFDILNGKNIKLSHKINVCVVKFFIISCKNDTIFI